MDDARGIFPEGESLNTPAFQETAFGESGGFRHLPEKIIKHPAAIGVALILIAAGFFISYQFIGQRLLPREYDEVYTLVPDKISQSAAIAMRLPRGIQVAVAEAKEKISFEPMIDGVWSPGKTSEYLIFQPAQKLELGRYYAIKLQTQNGDIKKDFLIDEDPKVVAIFPNANSEASEYSKITIVFNRPMVPLTTLDELMDKSVPVDITPVTQGRFKWITTKDLQFIPDKRLVRSARYTVSVKSGLVSMDGLPVSPTTTSFTTKTLRYSTNEQPQNRLLFNQPIRIFFNQPIDLDRTTKEISVKKSAGGGTDIITAYGTRRIFDKDTKKFTTYLDKSILEMYSKSDKYSREKLWDFNATYSYVVQKAYPLEGDIAVQTPFSGAISVHDVITSLGADSPRTRFSAPDFFDPQGKLWVNFAEDIDKDASQINAPGLRDVSYGEKCREPLPGEEVSYGSDCEKVPDYKKISLRFTPDELRKGQEFNVTFKKLVTKNGLTVNQDPVSKAIKTFSDLVVYKTTPSEGETGADLTKLKICTSNPLSVPDEKTFYDRVKSNVTVGLWNWYSPIRVTQERLAGTPSPCSAGQFENTILYGLVPNYNYSIALDLVDDFGQTAKKTVDFVSGNLKSVDRNFFSLQKQYNVTSPEKTKLAFGVDNLEYINLNICRVSPETMLSYIKENPKSDAPPGSLNCVESITKRVDLPKKFWSRIYFQIDLKEYISNPIGHFVLTFSHPEYRKIIQEWDSATQRYTTRTGGPIYEKTYLTVTRLAVQEKKVEWSDTGWGTDQEKQIAATELSKSSQNLYWVTDLTSLNPISNATVDLYGKNIERVGSYSTNNEGVSLTSAYYNLFGAVVRKGGDSAIVSAAVDKFAWAYPANGAERSYIYTDKPIYRPGQQVFIKGIYRLGYDMNYQIFQDRKADLTIRNSKYEVISKTPVTISDYGTYTADFTLDSQAPLGTYVISGPGGSAYFDVEEYMPAAFQVEAKSDKEEYIAGDTAKLTVDANYYFGVPLDGGDVEYSIVSQDYYFDRYHDGYFNFGSNWYYSYNGYYGDKFILRGKTTLDSEGHATIDEPLDFSTFFKNDEGKTSKILTFNISVRNKNGQTISSQKSLIVHRGKLYVGIRLDKNFIGKNEKTTARIKTVDTEGKPIGASNILLEVKKITWESFKRKEVDGNYYYRTEEKKDAVASYTLSTNGQGDGSKEISVPSEGEYEIGVTTKDSSGNSVTAQQELFAYGAGSASIKPTNNEALDLATDKQQVSVGDTVSIIIKSPYTKAKALVTLERGKIMEYHLLDITSNLTQFTFQVKESYIPNIYASVVLISPLPEVKFGQIQYQVDTKQKELSISVQSDKNNYLPGEEVHLKVFAKDWNGKPVKSELSLAVVDQSVLALKGNPKKDPVAFFYDGMPLSVSTASNIKNVLEEAEIPAGTKGGSGGGAENLATKKRGVFKETALWQGVVTTDSSGQAQISFTLPDNLTTWQIESVGVTKDTNLGAGYSEFKTDKQLMVVPLKPRFIVPGDTFYVGSQVFNQTDQSQSVQVSLTSKSLEIAGQHSQAVSLGPKTNKTIYFKAVAPERMEAGLHDFTLSAKSRGFEDTVENTIPIVPNQTYESVATAGYTNQAQNKEYVFLPSNVIGDKGGLSVKVNPTLAVFISDALNSMVQYPYGCSEQIASKLSSLAIVKRGLNIKNIGDNFSLPNATLDGVSYSPDDVIRIGLARLYQNQSSEGGFSYYSGMAPDPFLTMHVINTLIDIKNAGYEVNTAALNKAADYLYRQITQSKTTPTGYQYGYQASAANPFAENKELFIAATYTLGRVPGYSAASNLQGKIITIANDEKFIKDTSSNEALAYLALVLTNGYSADLKSKIFNELENRLVIDSRGSFLSTLNRNRFYEYYETPAKDTALLLKAFAKDERQSPLLPKILNWILASRSKDGSWGSTNTTVAVIDSLTDFLLWKKENLSNFKIQLSLDSKDEGGFTFDKSSILKFFEKFIPMQDIGLNTIKTVSFTKTNLNNESNNYYYGMLLKYFLPVEKIAPKNEGFSITREFYKIDDAKSATPIFEAKQGDVLRGHLTITVPESRNFVSVEDFIPAGMELINANLATEDQSLSDYDTVDDQGYYDYGYYGRGAGLLKNFTLASIGSFFNSLYDGVSVPLGGMPELDDEYYSDRTTEAGSLWPSAKELHDDRLFLFKDALAPGVYQYDYFVRALVPGEFHHLPAQVNEMYFPENFGRTRGDIFKILE